MFNYRFESVYETMNNNINSIEAYIGDRNQTRNVQVNKTMNKQDGSHNLWI